MRAAQISAYGGPQVVNVTDVTIPAISPDQVLVEVYAASLNPFDTKLREGVMKDSPLLHLPFTLGGDIAGVIFAVGINVTNFAVGDKIYGTASAVAGNSGAFAEYAATAASQIAKMPENLDFRQAASLPLVGASAWQALTQHIQLHAGQKIFIHGGAGGIGTVAIQIARSIGAKVATTATGPALAYVRQLGADTVIDYKTQDYTTVLKGYDAVFDTVGGDEFERALKVLHPGGMGVSMTASAREEVLEELGVKVTTQQTKVTAQALEALSALIASGAVTSHISQVYALQDIQAAFTARESGGVAGKIVIAIK